MNIPAMGRLFGKHRTEQTVSGEREIVAQTGHDNGELESSSQMLTDFLRDLYAVEGKKRGLVDFDLAPVDSRSERLKRMISSSPTKGETVDQFWVVREVRQELANTARPEDPRLAEQYDFLEKKLLAIDTVMQKKMLGADFDFNDYVELTQGITPEFIPDDMLDAQLEIVKKQYESKGVKVYDRESILKYKSEHQVPEEEIAGRLKDKGDRYLKILSDFLLQDVSPNYVIEMDNVDDYWINWAKGERDNFTLTINIHKRHDGKWVEGKDDEMSLHEIVGHFGQMNGWQKSIDAGNLIDALGITSVTDPEQITSEGIAQTIYYFVPEFSREVPEEGIIEIEQNGLRQMVYNNVHILLNTPGYPKEAVYEYVKKYLPAENDDDIEKHIKDRTEDPTKISYLMAYGYGYYLHREYSLCLNTSGKREFLKYLFSQPTTPEQEYNFVMGLVNDPEKKYGTGRIPFEDKPRVNPGDPPVRFPEISLAKAA